MADRTLTVYASIGNSDDKLTQVRWSDFTFAFSEHIFSVASRVLGHWYSLPNVMWQNACVAFEITEDKVIGLKDALVNLAIDFGQDSIAWAVVAETEFLSPSTQE